MHARIRYVQPDDDHIDRKRLRNRSFPNYASMLTNKTVKSRPRLKNTVNVSEVSI